VKRGSAANEKKQRRSDKKSSGVHNDESVRAERGLSRRNRGRLDVRGKCGLNRGESLNEPCLVRGAGEISPVTARFLLRMSIPSQPRGQALIASTYARFARQHGLNFSPGACTSAGDFILLPREGERLDLNEKTNTDRNFFFQRVLIGASVRPGMRRCRNSVNCGQLQ